MSPNRRRWRMLAGLCLTLLSMPVATLHGQDAAPGASTSSIDEAPFRNFEGWLSRGGLASRSSAPTSLEAADVAEGRTLALERRQALLRLARSDPRQALSRALPPSVLRGLPPPVREASEQYVDACGGEYSVEIADDFRRGDAPVSRVRRTLTVGDRTYEALVFGRRLGTPSKAIHVNGVAFDGAIVLFESPLRRLDPEEAATDPVVRARCGAPGPGCVAVKVGAQTLVFGDEAFLRRHQEALEADESSLGAKHGAGREEALQPVNAQDGGVSPASVWTTGEKTVLYIRADTSDRPGDPVTAATVQSTMDDAVNMYFQDVSYDRTSLRTTVMPTVRLPRTATEYETSVGDGQILTDAQAAARAAGYDPATYNLFIVAFPKMSFGYSGKARVGRAGVWLNGSFGSSVTAHELGHNYGVYHANLWQTTDGSVIGPGTNVEYGNVFDVMGRGGVRGHFNAWFKNRLDWLLPGEFTSVTSSGTYRIQAIDDPAASAERALKIVKDTTRSYWLEFRQAYTTNRWAMNGALVNWGYNTNTGSHLLDLTPGSASAQNDAALLVGRTLSDATAGVHVTPVARTTTPPSMDVVVKLGSFPGNSAPSATLAASSTTAARNEPVTLTVTASDLNGDALAYGWEFDDGTLAANVPAVTKGWSTAGTKVVRCLVSDMVGGTTVTSVTINVTSATTFSIGGTVTSNGQGLAGVVVAAGTRSATTSASGAYNITGLANGTYTLTPRLEGYTFSPPTLTVTVNGANVTGRNFTAAPVGGRILDVHFDGGADGFTYLDDAFRGTSQPSYASGGHAPTAGLTGGALRIALGGVDDADITGMSAGWRISFTLAEAQPVNLSFAYKLTQTSEYESNERSEVLAAIDGTLLGPGGLVAQVSGNGNGGSPRSVGYATFQASLGTLAAGPHTLTLGGFNNLKTLADESTEVLIDDVLLYRP